MAKSSGAKGLEFRKSLYGLEQPARLQFRVANSTTLTIGDVVRLNNAGFISLSGVGAPSLGVIDGICDDKGINMASLIYTNNTGATISGDDTVTTASDNQTRAEYVKASVIVDPSGSLLFYNDASGDLAQTNLGQLFDLVSTSDQIDQASASDTSGQFQLLVLDPDGDGDASKGLFRVSEPQLMSHVGNATAIIAA
jgi:hypothetical protein